ncbi:MAG: DUF5715 family protein [Bacteroides sp.]|nr:DUF5715 family protein [Bacteroides sp.]MCM1380109.1 DUF5715 family protein [Bacteroides sp.]MCM1445658.1 DUF5715 family protein [Prevotella sp.]
MNYRQAQIFLIVTIITAVVLIGGITLHSIFGKSKTAETPAEKQEVIELPQIVNGEPQQEKIHISPKVGNLAKQFNDLNEAHLVYATKIGIKPIRDTRDILRLSRPLRQINSTKHYKIDRLSHSYPYLVTRAAELLDTIGDRFNQKLKERGGAHYTLKVTSLLRTEESVKRLQRRNVNSTSNSAHLYGTTFDISYIDFYEHALNTTKLNNEQLKNILAEVLLELREEGRCLVKFERKESCFHITSTK